MGEQVVGRRERKKRATWAALSAAALQLSIERGIDDFTVEQSADEADVSLRTFFNFLGRRGREDFLFTGQVRPSAAAATRRAGPVLAPLRAADPAAAHTKRARRPRTVGLRPPGPV